MKLNTAGRSPAAIQCPAYAKLIVLALLIATAAPSPVLAWGRDGHRIVGDIANRYLDPKAAHEVRALLALENHTTLADVANWADDIKAQRPNTKPWHYVDIPISDTAYNAERDCATGDCIVAKIEEYRAELADKSAPAEERLEALKFIVHFVGDLHQPLHCADNSDKGGNDVKILGFSGSRNLHAVWDTGIIAHTDMAEPEVPAKLAAKITDGDVKTWQGGSVVDWANESYGIAKGLIYTHKPNQADKLAPSYATDAKPIVEVQLEKAAVRLAVLINSALD